MVMEVEKMKIQHSMQQMKLDAQAKERADRIREQEIQLERERHQAYLKQSTTTPPSTPTSISSTSPLPSQIIAEQPVPLQLEESSEKMENTVDKQETSEESKEIPIVNNPSEIIAEGEEEREKEKEVEKEEEKDEINEKEEQKEENETNKEEKMEETTEEEAKKEIEGEDDEGEDVSGWL